MKYGFAGDRLISVNLLSFLIDEGYKPSFLIVNETKDSSHREELISLSGLTDRDIYDIDFINKNYSILADYDTDYIFGIHFPYIIYPNTVSRIKNLRTPSFGAEYWCLLLCY